jgi:hypothetical protein
MKPFGVPSVEDNLRFLPSSFEADKSIRLILDCFDVKVLQGRFRRLWKKFMTTFERSRLLSSAMMSLFALCMDL